MNYLIEEPIFLTEENDCMIHVECMAVLELYAVNIRRVEYERLS